MIKFPTKIIMDTGPLFDFLLAGCWLTYFRTLPKKHLRYIKNERQYKNLRDYIFSVELIVISPYVIAEINYQVRKIIREEERDKFWKFSIEFLSDNKFQERIIKIIEINLQDLSKWGITDASLISLGEKTSLPVFTGDYPLWGYCKKKVKGGSSLFIDQITECK